MVRLPVWLLAGLAILTSGGCCQSRGQKGGSCCASSPPPLILPPAQRTIMEVQFRAGPIPPPHDGPTGPPIEYRLLTPEQCRCRAVEVQSMARMLDSQADSIAKQTNRCSLCKSCCERRRAALQEDILRGTAQELRNADAAVALNLYYRLVENETLAELSAESLREIADSLARIQELKDKGLKGDADVETMKRQQLEMQSDQAKIQLALDEISCELSQILDLQDGCCKVKVRIWPSVKLILPPGAPDCNKSVTEGLASRPELWVLQRVADELDECTIEVVRQLLGSVNPLLSMGSGGGIPCIRELVAMLCGKGALAEEVETRRAQVEEYRNSRMRTISGQIRQDVFSLCQRALLVSLAKEETRSWDRRVTDLLERQDRGMINYADVTDARLKWVKARGDVVREQTAWERLRVQLLMRQGLLLKPLPPPEPPGPPPQPVPGRAIIHELPPAGPSLSGGKPRP